jgi:hypothetical protein
LNVFILKAEVLNKFSIQWTRTSFEDRKEFLNMFSVPKLKEQKRNNNKGEKSLKISSQNHWVGGVL